MVQCCKREAKVVVELRFLRCERNGPLEQRQRFRRPSALMERDAEIMKRQRLFGVDAERGAIRALRSLDVASLVRGKPLLGERGRGSARSKRAVALLVSATAAAGA